METSCWGVIREMISALTAGVSTQRRKAYSRNDSEEINSQRRCSEGIFFRLNQGDALLQLLIIINVLLVLDRNLCDSQCLGEITFLLIQADEPLKSGHPKER